MSKTTNEFSPEVRERAVRLVLDNLGQHGSRWQAVLSISSKIGCAPQTLNDWVNKAEVDSGKRAGVSSEMAEKMKALERENRELRQANEILRKGETIFRHWSEDNGRTLILRWRSSTADTGHDRLHRRSQGQARGRADLRGSADRPCHPL
jgi:transposase-like protein